MDDLAGAETLEGRLDGIKMDLDWTVDTGNSEFVPTPGHGHRAGHGAYLLPS